MRRMLLAVMALTILTTGWIYREQLISTAGGIQSGQAVISLGQDLTPTQKNEIMSLFGTKGDLSNVRIVTVTNAEERKYLEGKIDEKIIGTKAISCALVIGTSQGQGIEVQTHNINGVSPFMYANAANTAGIKDVRINVAAPFEVSGTAALTGIIKAFELASGNNLSEKAKETANQEVAESSKLGQKIGEEQAGRFIYEVKKRIVEKKVTDPTEIRNIIIQVSAELNISLTEDEITRIVNLMVNINNLNINITNLNQQLDRLQTGIQEVRTGTEQTRGFMQRIIDFIRALLQSLTGALS